MTRQRKRRIPAPAIAIVIIVVCAVAAEVWLIPPSRPAIVPADKEETSSLAPERTAKAQSEPAAKQEPPRPPAKPTTHETPRATIWSAYHGDARLTGLVDVELGDEIDLLWRFQADGEIRQPPVQNQSGIFFSTYRAVVYSLDLNGNQRWRVALVDPAAPDKSLRVDAPVAASESHVFVGTNRGMLFALNSADATIAWQTNIGGAILGAPIPYKADATGAERIFVISQEDGVLHCLDAATGDPVWRAEAIDRCDGSAAIGNGTVVFGSCAAALHVFSAADGKLIREIELDADSQVAAGPAFAGASIFAGAHSGKFFHGDANSGELIWTFEDNYGEIFSTPAVNERIVIFSSDDGKVYALDRDDGSLLWEWDSEGIPSSPVIANNRVVVSADGVLFLLDIASGKPVWTHEISDEITSPAMIGGYVIVGADDGSLTAFGVKEGRTS